MSTVPLRPRQLPSESDKTDATQEYLIECGHESEMVSRNNDLETPLMLASAAGKEDMGVTLAKRFPDCISWQDKAGLDAVGHPYLSSIKPY